MAVEVSAASRRLVRAVSSNRLYRDAFEIALVGVAFLLYFLVRGSVVDRDAEALRNALNIVDIERALGFFWEPRLNEVAVDHRALYELFNQVYFWLDFPVIVAVGLWMYFFGHRHEYTVARDGVLASGAIALVVYHLFPVMPPRLVPPSHGFGFVDTVKEYSNVSYQAQSAQPFVNPYAAVPSLHFGWQLLVGGVLIWTSSHWLARGIGALMPVQQLAAVVFTANHYILDAMAGAVVALMGLLVAMALQRWGYAAVRSLAGRMLAQPGPAARSPPG